MFSEVFFFFLICIFVPVANSEETEDLLQKHDVQLCRKIRRTGNSRQVVPHGKNLPELGGGGPAPMGSNAYSPRPQPAVFPAQPGIRVHRRVAGTAVLGGCCPLRTQTRVRWGTGVGPHQPPSLCPLGLLPSPPFLVPGRGSTHTCRVEEGVRVSHPETPLQEAAWSASRDVSSGVRRLGMDCYPPLTSVSLWGVGSYVPFCAFSYPSGRWE